MRNYKCLQRRPAASGDNPGATIQQLIRARVSTVWAPKGETAVCQGGVTLWRGTPKSPAGPRADSVLGRLRQHQGEGISLLHQLSGNGHSIVYSVVTWLKSAKLSLGI